MGKQDLIGESIVVLEPGVLNVDTIQEKSGILALNVCRLLDSCT
jgi:hypothetical protein